jgi:hypothetical protein
MSNNSTSNNCTKNRENNINILSVLTFRSVRHRSDVSRLFGKGEMGWSTQMPQVRKRQDELFPQVEKDLQMFKMLQAIQRYTGNYF